MSISKGEIVEGIVGKITEYGAFINLPEGKKGLVHISEIADTYVKNVNDYLKERQKIKVKILNVSPDWRKIDLSVKQASDNKIQATGAVAGVSDKKIEDLHHVLRNRNQGMSRERSSEGYSQTFEEKLAKFLKSSEERQADLKRNIEAKRGGGKYIK